MADREVTHDDLNSKLHDLRTLLKSDMAEVREDLKERIEGVCEQIQTQNGRVGKSEIKIAILEDRSNRAEQAAAAASQAAIASASAAATAQKDAKNAGLSWGAGAGSAAAAALWGIWQFVKSLGQ